MIIVGNALVRHQLQRQQQWYLIFGFVLLAISLGFMLGLLFSIASVFWMWGLAMLFGGVLQLFASFKCFKTMFIWFWGAFAVFYLLAGAYALYIAQENSVSIPHVLAIFLLCVGFLRTLHGLFFCTLQGWVWVFCSGLLNIALGLLSFCIPTLPFWIFGIFFALDIFVQGLHYFSLAAAIGQISLHADHTESNSSTFLR